MRACGGGAGQGGAVRCVHAGGAVQCGARPGGIEEGGLDAAAADARIGPRRPAAREGGGGVGVLGLVANDGARAARRCRQRRRHTRRHLPKGRAWMCL